MSTKHGSLLLIAALLFSISTEAQKSGLVLDLTSPPPRGQQGLGIPAMSFSMTEGQPVDEHKYGIPLRVEIVRASVESSGDLILQVKVKNTGQVAVELPISRNVLDVERTPGSFRRSLSFAVHPVGSESKVPNVVGMTVGSHAVLHSLVRLGPQQSIRVLLRVESRWIKDSLLKGEKELRLQVTCGEWALANDRFFLESTAKDVISDNTAVLKFSDSLSTATVSGP